MPLDRDLDRGVLTEERGVGLNRSLLVGPDVVLVVVVEDVLHLLIEQLFFAGARCGRRWRWLSYGDACGRLLAATRSFSRKRVGGGVSRRGALRAARLHGADALNGHLGCVLRFPDERGGLTLVNRTRVS